MADVVQEQAPPAEAGSAEAGRGPVGHGDYVVSPGDCISSIAADFGFFPDTLWDHPENADLKRIRGSPNILLPGDRVYIPEKTARVESAATDRVHKFVRLGVPEKLSIQFRRDGQPRAGEDYELIIDEVSSSGKTDRDGRVVQSIPPNAKSGRLTFAKGRAEEETYVLRLGHMDPIDELSGVQARLTNLGFDCGPADGRMNDATAAALEAFQTAFGLTQTGQPDRETRDALVQQHGS